MMERNRNTALRSWRGAVVLAGLLGALLPAVSWAKEVTEVIDGVEWTTNRDFPPIGSPDAKKGGELRISIPNFVPTLRNSGPNTRLTTITDIYGLCYDRLLGMHPETLEWIPGLASHWRVSKDKRTYWFRIDPRARFSNGKEVTAEDVKASFEFLVNPDIKDPSTREFYSRYYDTPVVHDKYTVSVHTKELNWRLMIYFASSMVIYPADEIRIPGDVYLREFNWKMMSGTGPYIIQKPEDIVQEQSLTLTRRKDYWAKDDPGNRNLYNFDKIHFIVVRNRELAFEKFKKGELDYYKVMRSQRWVEECNFDKIEKGWIQKRKIYNEQPQGYSGYAFNMRTWPFNDKRVRLAFCYAFNRKELFDKFFYGEYEYVDSYWPGSEWGNPDNAPIRYNPHLAERLLDQAGYKERNAEGVRIDGKTGRPLELTLEYWDQGFERINRLVAEDLFKIGMKLNLKLVDANSLTKRVGERKFTVLFQSWRAILFPNPFTSWHSSLADKPDNNNLTGFANSRVDALMSLYDQTFAREKQIEYIHEMDSIIYREHPYALAWFAPFVRLLYWNRFGMPATVLTRYTDERAVWSTWWADPDKQKALDDAMKNDKKLPVGVTDVDPWNQKARLEAAKKKAAQSGG